MNEDRLHVAHRHSFKSKDEILQSTIAGCFYCKRTFSPVEIKEWVDEGQTALCPHCGIDAVVGDASGIVVDANFLNEMNQRWF